MKSRRNNDHFTAQPLPFSTQVGRGPADAEQPSPVPSVNAMVATQEKPTDSKLHASLNIDHWWGWDILGLGMALAVLIAIIVILRMYDGEQQPSWRGI
ncbi:hypothetical protein N7463_007455 [Penicillium fimorum]|uniref:Uncharacterized protein n=1 Tax=Penicillium fimorum TaxID=1882269 RepID=A0A9W9XX53_9EURO|nr:hypothetical protein N7463_007455 [Penicillium fimorum]